MPRIVLPLTRERTSSRDAGTELEEAIAETLRRRLGRDPEGRSLVSARVVGASLVVGVPAGVLAHLVGRTLGPGLDPIAERAGVGIVWPPPEPCAVTPIVDVWGAWWPIVRRQPGEPLRPLASPPPKLPDATLDRIVWMSLTGRCTCPMCDPDDSVADLPEVRRAWELLDGVGAPVELERHAAGDPAARQVLSDWLAEREAAPAENVLASLLVSRVTPRASGTD